MWERRWIELLKAQGISFSTNYMSHFLSYLTVALRLESSLICRFAGTYWIETILQFDGNGPSWSRSHSKAGICSFAQCGNAWNCSMIQYCFLARCRYLAEICIMSNHSRASTKTVTWVSCHARVCHACNASSTLSSIWASVVCSVQKTQVTNFSSTTCKPGAWNTSNAWSCMALNQSILISCIIASKISEVQLHNIPYRSIMSTACINLIEAK